MLWRTSPPLTHHAESSCIVGILYWRASFSLSERARLRADENSWLNNGIITNRNFEASLNFSDTLYGSSLNYAKKIDEKYNASVTVDSPYAVGGTVLMTALKAAGTKDRKAVMEKMARNHSNPVSLSFNSSRYYFPCIWYQHSQFCAINNTAQVTWHSIISELVNKNETLFTHMSFNHIDSEREACIPDGVCMCVWVCACACACKRTSFCSNHFYPFFKKI